MELRHLRYFVAVAEEENVTRAAARLHVSQPPLSRQLRDLEEELGLRLFDRGPKSLRLTAEGRVFLLEARAVLDRAEQAVRVASTLAGREAGEIHVGYAPSLTVEILPLTLREFESMSGGVRVRLHDFSTEEMLAGLRDASLDVALMIKPHAGSLRGLEFQKLREHAVCVAVHPAHPLAAKARIDLLQIARERLIVYSKEDYPEYHAWLGRLFSKSGFSPRIGEAHDSATSLIAAVESGFGVALVQQGFECLSGPRLSVCPLSPAPPPFVVGVVSRKEDCRKLVETFRAAATTAESGPTSTSKTSATSNKRWNNWTSPSAPATGF